MRFGFHLFMVDPAEHLEIPRTAEEAGWDRHFAPGRGDRLLFDLPGLVLARLRAAFVATQPGRSVGCHHGQSIPWGIKILLSIDIRMSMCILTSIATETPPQAYTT